MLGKLEDIYTVSDLFADQSPMKRIVQKQICKITQRTEIVLKKLKNH